MSETLLQPTYSRMHYSLELIQQHPFCIVLSFFFLASNKNRIFNSIIIQRHIFSCWESLQWHGSNPPAGLTCYEGKGEVKLSKTAEQHHQMPEKSQCLSPVLPLPSSALSSFPHSPELFVLHLEPSWVPAKHPGGQEGCYRSRVTILWWITSRICPGKRRIPDLGDGNTLKVIGQSSQQ